MRFTDTLAQHQKTSLPFSTGSEAYREGDLANGRQARLTSRTSDDARFFFHRR